MHIDKNIKTLLIRLKRFDKLKENLVNIFIYMYTVWISDGFGSKFTDILKIKFDKKTKD